MTGDDFNCERCSDTGMIENDPPRKIKGGGYVTNEPCLVCRRPLTYKELSLLIEEMFNPQNTPHS